MIHVIVTHSNTFIVTQSVISDRIISYKVTNDGVISGGFIVSRIAQ